MSVLSREHNKTLDYSEVQSSFETFISHRLPLASSFPFRHFFSLLLLLLLFFPLPASILVSDLFMGPAVYSVHFPK